MMNFQLSVNSTLFKNDDQPNYEKESVAALNAFLVDLFSKEPYPTVPIMRVQYVASRIREWASANSFPALQAALETNIGVGFSLAGEEQRVDLAVPGEEPETFALIVSMEEDAVPAILPDFLPHPNEEIGKFIAATRVGTDSISKVDAETTVLNALGEKYGKELMDGITTELAFPTVFLKEGHVDFMLQDGNGSVVLAFRFNA